MSKLRHWKQHFQKDAKFVWKKSVLWNGVMTVVGQEIPQKLQDNKAKLRRFWDSKTIELQLFTLPDVITGKPKPRRKARVAATAVKVT